MPNPVGKQIEVVGLSPTGHHVVLGSAGSGKTTMAVLRAKFLSNPRLPGSGRTLIITYNKVLMRYIASGGALAAASITVENYHLFARGYLNSKGLLPGTSIISIGNRTKLINQAIENVAAKYEENTFFHRHEKFFLEEIKWLAGHNLANVDAYVSARRTGRADANLSRALRPVMWEIRAEYLALRKASGRLYDFDDIAGAVSAAFDSDGTARRYRHIIIDEGQDMSPEMIRSLTKAVPADGSVTFFGDVAQQIYGRGISWRDAGMRPAKVWEFRQNYRNTVSIAKLGLAISQMPYYADQADMVEPIFPVADGPKPALVEFGTKVEEIRFVIGLARERAQRGSVVILLRTYEQIAGIKNLLPVTAIPLKEDVGLWDSVAGLYYGTYHSAKGLEFDIVMLPYMSAVDMPSAADIAMDGQDAAMEQDGRLLYVGVTRAKSELILTYTAAASLLLPADRTLFNESKR